MSQSKLVITGRSNVPSLPLQFKGSLEKPLNPILCIIEAKLWCRDIQHHNTLLNDICQNGSFTLHML